MIYITNKEFFGKNINFSIYRLYLNTKIIEDNYKRVGIFKFPNSWEYITIKQMKNPNRKEYYISEVGTFNKVKIFIDKRKRRTAGKYTISVPYILME